MTAFLLSVHVVAAIVLVGPMTVAASLFPRYAREASEGVAAGVGAAGPMAVASAMHRISRAYAVVAVVVPVFGIATAVRLGVLGDLWLVASMLLTAVAAVLLAFAVVPGQRRVLDALRGLAGSPGSPSPGASDAVAPVPVAVLARLSMITGIFALTWVVVTVLMIVRPGSTTSAGVYP